METRLSRYGLIGFFCSFLISTQLPAAQFRELQSFVCTETVQHFKNGEQAGTYSYQVSFEDGRESYAPRVAHLETWSEGEYGSLLRITEELTAGRVQPGTKYLEFETKAGEKPWSYWQAGHLYKLGIRAYVQFDSAGRIYSVTWRAKHLPSELHLRQLEWRVVLGPLDGFDALVPVSGMFAVTNSDGSSSVNMLRFEEYRHYGAESRLLASAEGK